RRDRADLQRLDAGLVHYFRPARALRRACRAGELGHGQTTVRIGPGSSSAVQPAAHRFLEAAARPQLDPAVEDDAIIAEGAALHRPHLVAIDEDRAVDAQETLGIEPRFQVLHRLAQQVALAAGVNLDVVACGLDPIDVRGAHEFDAARVLDRDLARIAAAL